MKSSNRSPWKRFFYSPIGIVIAIIVFVLIVRGAWNIHEKALIAKDRLEQAQAELANLQRQQASLSVSVANLSTPTGIEAELREKYHAVKEGESVAVIIDSSASRNATTSTQVSSSTPKLSWWGRMIRMIGF